MNKALIDTDIFSELGKGVNQTVAGNGATYRAAFGRYTISVITVMEIVRGFQKKQSPRRLQAFLRHPTRWRRVRRPGQARTPR